MRCSVGEQRLLGVECVVFVRVVDAGGIEFVDLEPEQVDLTGPQPFVAAERSERRVDLGEAGPSGSERLEVDLAELVERGSLGRHREQTLVSVLTVQVDHVGGDLGQRRHRGRATVDVGAGATVGGDHPTEDPLGAVGLHESTLDPRFGRHRDERSRHRLDRRRGVRSPRRASSCRRPFRPSMR